MTNTVVIPVVNHEQLETLLLVDDNPTNLRVLFHALKGRGQELLMANDGEEALKAAAEKRPDLILLDVMMPKMDGFEVCRRLKGDAATRDIVIIFLSALEDTKDKVRGLELGAADYITKPFMPAEVIARVDNQLKMHRLEQTLMHQNRRLKAANQQVLEAIGEGVYGLARDGSVTFANPRAAELAGVRREEELIGKTIHELHLHSRADGSPRPEDECAVYATLADGEARDVDDDVFWRADGSSIPVDQTCTPLFAEGELAGAVTVFRDISRRKRDEHALRETHKALLESHEALKQAQQQLVHVAKLETVGRLAAGVAHEVKNPLAVVQMGIDFLRTSLKPEGNVDGVLIDMDDAIDRADTVIKGMLDFARLKEAQMAPGDINAVIRKSIHLVSYELSQQTIRIDQRLADNLPPVNLDADKMQQVFINLFMNAAHAMGKSGELTVTSRQRTLEGVAELGYIGKEHFTAGDKVVSICIEDTGPGFAAHVIDKVFDPFFTTKPVGEGTGLGLSVTRNIIGLHEGTINLGNREPCGARITINLKALAGVE